MENNHLPLELTQGSYRLLDPEDTEGQVLTTGIGGQAMWASSTGSHNIALGYNALCSTVPNITVTNTGGYYPSTTTCSTVMYKYSMGTDPFDYPSAQTQELNIWNTD